VEQFFETADPLGDAERVEAKHHWETREEECGTELHQAAQVVSGEHYLAPTAATPVLLRGIFPHLARLVYLLEVNRK